MKMSVADPHQQFRLRWNNHSTNMVSVFEQLFRTEAFTDVTVALHDGTSFKCHKVVLASCSPYFEELFLKNPCEHPTIILSDVKICEIQAILDYVYKGETNVKQSNLNSLLRVAGFLKIKGLVEETSIDKMETTDHSASPPPDISTSTSSTAHSTDLASPPHIPSSNYSQYAKSPIERNNGGLWPTVAFPGIPMPQPVPGIIPRSHLPILGGSYENCADISPLSRKKISSLMANRDTPILRNVLDQGQADSAPMMLGRLPERQDSSNSNGSAHDSDRRNSAEFSEPMDDDDRRVSPHNYSPHSENRSNTTSGKPEWKRYKQYTRDDITSAMAVVRNKEMSALQAARKYGVPSRTLYDKLKKAGILPSRGASIQRHGREPSSARFPYSSTINGSVYGAHSSSAHLSESEGESNNGLLNNDSPYGGLLGSGGGGGVGSTSMVDGAMDMSSTRTPSPPPDRKLIIDDEVEDLSVNRSTRDPPPPIPELRLISQAPPPLLAPRSPPPAIPMKLQPKEEDLDDVDTGEQEPPIRA